MNIHSTYLPVATKAPYQEGFPQDFRRIVYHLLDVDIWRPLVEYAHNLLYAAEFGDEVEMGDALDAATDAPACLKRALAEDEKSRQCIDLTIEVLRCRNNDRKPFDGDAVRKVLLAELPQYLGEYFDGGPDHRR